MKVSFYKIILGFLLLLELGYSFVQYQHQTFDGDVVPIVLPIAHYQPILEQPFGVLAIRDGVSYAGPNRFFLHFSMYHYFRKMPIFLQNFVSPIGSIYLAASIFKLFVHSLLLCLLAVYVRACFSPARYTFLWAAVLIAPLFQTTQFNLYMGLISPAVTYTFAYGFFFAFLLLFFLPFHQKAMGQVAIIKKWNIITYALWAFLAFFVAFSSPLIPAVGLLVCPVLVLYFFYKKKLGHIIALPKPLIFLFSWFVLLCLYSFYLGTFNAENSDVMSIAERYQRLGIGIFRQLTTKIGFPLLMFFLLLNYGLIQYIKRRTKPVYQAGLIVKIQGLFKWIAIFSCLYILLLPLGGYRYYRPYILRSDTLIPVLLALYFLFGLSSLFLLKYFYHIRQKTYSFVLLVLLSFFTIADEPNFGKNACEKTALQQIAQSTQNVVLLEEDCSVLAWKTTIVPSFSKDIATMLLYWNIIEEERLFYYQTKNDE